MQDVKGKPYLHTNKNKNKKKMEKKYI